MKKSRVHDYFGVYDHMKHVPSIDADDFVVSRAIAIFEGAKNDLFSNFDKNVLKKSSLWNPSQRVAIVRAKWDQPISTVRQLLSFCTTESLEKNKQHILDYFVECYDWLDLAVAIRIYETIAHPMRAYIMDGISFDRHYNNNRERYSDGKNGKPYLSINMLGDFTAGDLIDFIEEYFGVFYSDNLPKPKINEATPYLLRNILIRNMHYLYDIKPKDLMGLINYIFTEYKEEKGKIVEQIPDKIADIFYLYNEQNASNDFGRMNREIERDWFREAINTFENDRTRNLDVYKKHYFKMMTEHNPPEAPISGWPEITLLDDPIYEWTEEQMKRFELKFNNKQNLFSLKKI